MGAEHEVIQLTGLVLAAGRGTRFDPLGQEDKLLARLSTGLTVLRSSCLALAPHVDELVVVLRTPSPLIQAELTDLAPRFVYCDTADQGLGYSLAQGVRQTQPTLAWVVSLGDMPFISAESYHQLLMYFKQHGGIVRPTYQEQIGHPVLFSAQYKHDLMRVVHESGPRHMFKRYAHFCHYVAVNDVGVCADIDYPHQLT